MSKIIHFEIAANDPEKLAKFYADTFGWEIHEWEQGKMVEEANRYWLIKAGPKEEQGANGGMYKRQQPISAGGPNAFICNIAVENIENAVEKIKTYGGTAEEIMKMPNIGKSAAAKDPEGNMFAVFEPDPNAKMQDM